MARWENIRSARIRVEISFGLVWSEDNSRLGRCATFTDPEMTNGDGPSLTRLTRRFHYPLVQETDQTHYFAPMLGQTPMGR